MSDITLQDLIQLLVDKNARITLGYRWLCAEERFGDKTFVVLERLPYKKNTTVIYEGTSLASALDFVGRDE